MYKCEHFKIQELVSKIVYDRFKDFAWSFFDENVLKDLDTIIESIINNIYPNASEYSFSFSYTSESSLDLESLRYFDSLIAKYEGYLFSEKDFKEISPDILFDKLPNEIKNKYSTKIKNDNYIDILNQILQKEKLWLFLTIQIILIL